MGKASYGFFNRFFFCAIECKGNLVINEGQAAIVRRVFDEFMNGLNPEAIASALNSEGGAGVHGRAEVGGLHHHAHPPK